MSISIKLKQNAKQQISKLLDSKIFFLQNEIQKLTIESSLNAKSSAGDKHETTTAQVHLEQEKLAMQLSVNKKYINTVQLLSEKESKSLVTLSSLVLTNQGIFYLSVPLGKIIIDDLAIMVISVDSPLGKVFLHAIVGNEVTFGDLVYKILDVC